MKKKELINTAKDKEDHKKRHIELHKALYELLADYIGHHPTEIMFTEMPIKKLLDWSFEQTQNPDKENLKL